MAEKQQVAEVPHLWGIRKEDLGMLEHNYSAIQSLFFGQHNIAIPEQMLDVLNPVEIVAQYIGANMVKSGNSHHANPAFKDFDQVIRTVNGMAYPHLGRVKNFFNTRFSTNPGDEQARLAGLDDTVREAYMKSFLKEYLAPKRKNAFGEWHGNFYDPNYDTRRKIGSVYINQSYEKIKKLWESYKGK